MADKTRTFIIQAFSIGELQKKLRRHESDMFGYTVRAFTHTVTARSTHHFYTVIIQGYSPEDIAEMEANPT